MWIMRHHRLQYWFYPLAILLLMSSEAPNHISASGLARAEQRHALALPAR